MNLFNTPYAVCIHNWIRCQAPPIERQPVAPPSAGEGKAVIEPGNPQALPPDRRYICSRCGAEVWV